ncbi:DUF4232 domain-containing protein [Streptomyces sp. NPDC059850]|uniref:DUF4232 domain-containing protein n=1 Tax=Streptomyces sp. NPDC059850 TaxID=3346970 RepID=UPI00365861CE
MMRVQKISLLALTVAAGLSLSACQGGDSSSQGSGDSSASAAPKSDTGTDSPDGSSGSGSSGDIGASGGAEAGGGASSGACKTSQLEFSSSHGMGEGTLLVNLKNTGSADCTLQGFPGVDLKSKDGSISAERGDDTPQKVSVKPGEETRFTLTYPPNTSGGTGATFTSLAVTPPGETHAASVPVTINVPASDSATSAVTVEPVGSGK